MIASALHALTSLKSLLADAVHGEDPGTLAECLQGSHLPALGGDQHPAEIVYQALALPPVDPEILEGAARLLAPLCHAQAAALRRMSTSALAIAGGGGRAVPTNAPGQAPSPSEEALLFNLLLFASFLPTNGDLFSALQALLEAGLRPEAFTAGMGRSARQLRQALIVHQTDETLEGYWLGLMGEPPRLSRLPAERKGELLDAWTGLLWIPPVPEDREAGRVPSIERVEHGLLALHRVAGDTADGLSLLRYAVRQLDEAYPRSPESWATWLEPRFADWPQILRDVVAERWSRLGGEEAEDIVPAGRAREAWRRLPAETREEIRAAVQGADPAAWQSLWEGLIFVAPPGGVPRQSWVGDLQSVRGALEERHPGLHRGQPAPPAVEVPDQGSEFERKKPSRVDRLSAFERVSRAVAAIESRLAAGDLRRARRFLEDLVRDQEASETEPELIVKTLCNVAASAAAADELEWARSLYEDARMRVVDDPVPSSGLAEVLKAQERYVEAESLYRATVERFPSDVVARTGLAEVLKAQERYVEAEALYRETVVQFPSNAVARNGLAEVLKAQERYVEAEALYRETAEQFPGDVVARSGLAEVLKAQERYVEAEALYRETVVRFPSNVFARNGLAEVLKAQERYGEAEVLYRETAVRFPSDAIARNGLAEVLKAQERYGEAESLYRETVVRFPSNVFARSGLAEVLKAQERYGEAEALYRETAARFPSNVFARSGLAEVLKAQERYGEAESLYRETVARFPSNVVARSGLAEVLKARERYGEAESLYRETVERFPSNVVARNGLAEVLKAQEQYGEAEALYRETVERFPSNVVAQSGLAEVLKVQERYGEAEALYRETAQQFPSDTVARNGLAEVLRVQGRYGAAEALYRETAEQSPSNAVARSGLAEVLKAQERYGEAEALYRETAERFPNDRVSRNGYANLLRKLGRLDEALQLVPEPPDLRGLQDYYDLHLRGMIFLTEGDVSSAIVSFKRGLDSNPPRRMRPSYHGALAVARLRERRFEDAQRELAATSDDTPEYGALRLHAMAGQGRIAEAKEMYRGVSARVLTFRKPTARAVEEISLAWGLRPDLEAREPSAPEVEGVIAAEIEMLLAA